MEINQHEVLTHHNNNVDIDKNRCNYLDRETVLIEGNPVQNGDTITINDNDEPGDHVTDEDYVYLIKTQSKANPRDTFFADVSDLFNQLDYRLKSCLSTATYKQLESLLVSLEQGFNQILSTSVYYEFKNLPANGFITYCVMVRALLTKCCRKFQDDQANNSVNKSDYINDLKIVINGFLMLKDLLLHFHQSQLDNERNNNNEKRSPSNMNDVHGDADDDAIQSDSNDVNSLPLFSADIDETIYQMTHFFQTSEFQEALTRSFNLFWLPSKTRAIIKMYQKGVSWTYANFINSWRVLTNKRYRCKTFVKLANRANIGFPIDMGTIIDSHISRKVSRNLIYRHKHAVGANFWIPGQGRWIIPDSGPGIIEQNPPLSNRPAIRCRFIRHRTKPVRSDVLIFHCHGSGFVLSRPDFHDAYLKPWVSELDGCTVLSVDYSLKAQYPRQFQDVLDAYLWVTSGDDSVTEKIGFHPKKIILIGDSAGSMLAFNIPLLLHEIAAKKDPMESINMPVAYISIYGTFALTGAWSASRIMTLFDPILHYGNILAIAGCLSGIQGRIENPKDIPKNRLVKVSSYIAEDIRLIKRALKPRDIEPWYFKNGKIDADQFHRLFGILQSPYLNCPSYESYESLKDISICLITSFGCTFLDDNIAVARVWRGPVEVHVLEGQIHGFMFMRHEKTATKFVDNKVIEFVNRFAKQSNEF